jgi:hypothetical protein
LVDLQMRVTLKFAKHGRKTTLADLAKHFEKAASGK